MTYSSASNEESLEFDKEVKDIKDPFRDTVLQTLDGGELRRGDEGFESELKKLFWGHNCREICPNAFYDLCGFVLFIRRYRIYEYKES